MNWVTTSVRSTLIILVIFLVLVPGSVSAQAAALLVPYQGFLTDGTGQPINEPKDMTFRFFTELTGGTPLFEENEADVQVKNGVFQTILGDGSPEIPTELAGQELFLEIEIFGDSTPLSPRQRLRIPGTPAPQVIVTAISDGATPSLELRRARVGPTQVELDDTLGLVLGGGFDGTDYEIAAAIRFGVDGDPGLDNMPGNIIFSTTPDDSNEPVEHMIIDSQGNVTIKTPSGPVRLKIESNRSRVFLDTILDTTSDGTQRAEFRGRLWRTGRTQVQNNDKVVSFAGHGFDGETQEKLAEIRMVVDGQTGFLDMPGRIEFRTRLDGPGLPMNTNMVIKNTGDVGIGTTTPQSSLQISGYIQLDLTSGAPPAADCDELSERGRMKVDNAAGSIFVCVDSGWIAK